MPDFKPWRKGFSAIRAEAQAVAEAVTYNNQSQKVLVLEALSVTLVNNFLETLIKKVK